jgi:hypothetical protein
MSLAVLDGGREVDPEGWLWQPARLFAVVAAAGLPRELAAVMGPEEHDGLVRASHEAGISPVGTHVGTPVVAVPGPDGPVAWFGPVPSRVPRGEAAGRLGDGVLLVAGTPGSHELKGAPHAPPVT